MRTRKAAGEAVRGEELTKDRKRCYSPVQEPNLPVQRTAGTLLGYCRGAGVRALTAGALDEIA